MATDESFPNGFYEVCQYRDASADEVLFDVYLYPPFGWRVADHPEPLTYPKVGYASNQYLEGANKFNQFQLDQFKAWMKMLGIPMIFIGKVDHARV